MTNDKEVKFVTAASTRGWVSYRFIEVGDYDSNASSVNTVVHIRKRNTQCFANDGGNGGADRQDVYLWSQSE